MNRFRMLACDLDGTLLDERGQLTDPVTDLWQEARDHGIAVVAATGRRPSSALGLLQKAGVTGDCVVLNGAAVVDIERGTIRRGTYLDAAFARRVIDCMQALGFGPLVYSSGAPDRFECTFEVDIPDPTGYLRFYRSHAAGRLREVRSLSEHRFPETARVVTHDSAERLAQLLEALRPMLIDGSARAFQSFDTALCLHRVEVLHRYATKWEGVRWVAEGLKIAPQQIFAVGDDNNDVELLSGAGDSLAAPGASLPARAAAARWLEPDGGPSHLRVVAQVRQSLGLSPASSPDGNGRP